MNNPKNLTFSQQTSHQFRRVKGYTLIEIMLVLAIISVLLGAGIYYLIGNLDIAKERRVQADIATITTQLKTYEMQNLYMPTTEQGLQALVEEPSTDPKPRRWRQLMEKLPEDPWGMPYNYRNPGLKNPNGFDLYSFGAERKENDKEMGNWNVNN
ncbi:MAG: type II secretion system major pseudopilin GspG [Chthoniobacteraceae bacterium]